MKEEAMGMTRIGKIISFLLIVWKREGEDRKGRFVFKFSKQRHNLE